MWSLKTVKNIRRIPGWRLNSHRNGSLTVVAIIFVSVIFTCLVFQCVSYKQKIETIDTMTQIYQKKYRQVVKINRKSLKNSSKQVVNQITKAHR